MKTIDNPDLYGISRDIFIPRMVELWSGLGNHTSPALEEAWGVLVDTFNSQLIDAPQHNWAVVPMPTGTGKTQGLALYCALMAKQGNKAGILIVTQFIAEATNIVNRINDLAGIGTAISYNHQNKIENSGLCNDASVLVITHKSFINILEAEALGNKVASNWHKFLEWKNGRRKLIVIDEALDIVKNIKISIDDLRLVRAIIPHAVALKFPNEVNTIDSVISTLNSGLSESTDNLLESTFWELSSPDFNPLLEELKHYAFDKRILGFTNKEANTSLSRQFTEILQQLKHLLTNWSNFSQFDDIPCLIGAYVMLPLELRSVVILDATAMSNKQYSLLSGIPYFKELPANIRNYQNVKLNVFWGYDVGKVTLSKKPAKYFKEIIKSLSGYIGANNKVLFCTHKDVEKNFENLQTKYKESGVMHWGAIAGKNLWNDYDSIVIYGLPFLNPKTPTDTFRAFFDWHGKSNGKYEEAIPYWVDEPNEIYFHEVYVDEADYQNNEYLIGHMVASLIQAINRVRCRRVIDSNGNCEATNIYLFLRGGKLHQDILDGVTKLMPNINVIEYGNTEKEEAKSRDEDKLLEYLAKLKTGNHDAGKIQDKLEISDTTMRRMVKQIKLGGRLKSNLDILGISYNAKRGKDGYKYFSIGKSGGN